MKLDSLIPGAPALDITGITADSRKVRSGFLFHQKNIPLLPTRQMKRVGCR